MIWLLADQNDRISDSTQSLLEDIRNSVAVSAVSVWEIALKRSRRGLAIRDGWSQRLTELGFDALPITSEHAEMVEALPWHHRDPFDRLLVAQAIIERLTLVSADQQLSAYDVEVVW